MTMICLFGTTRLEDGDDVVLPELGGSKPRQVLELLALSHGRVVTKDQLAEALWDGNPPPTHEATVQSHVCLLRRRLQRHGVADTAIRTATRGYLLSDDVEVDVTLLRRALRRSGEQPSPATAAQLIRVLPSIDSPLLESDPYAGWALEARDRLDLELGQGLRTAALRLLEVGDHDHAVALAHRAAHAEPWSEATQQLLMRALAQGGARVDAMLAFARFRRRLRDDLGLEPSPETLAVHLDIATGRRGRAGRDDRQERLVLLQLLEQCSADPGPRPAQGPTRTAGAARAGLPGHPAAGGVAARTRVATAS